MGSLGPRPICLILLALVWLACQARDEAEQAGSPMPPAEADALQNAGMTSPLGGIDPAELRVDGPAEAVLVRSGDGVFITVGEYNAWVGTYPLNITTEDAAEARRQAIEQMVTFKLLAREARESDDAAGSAADETTLAMGYVRAWVTNTSSVTDEEARAYEDRAPERFAQLQLDNVPPQVKMMAIKGSIRGEELWAQVQAWMEEAEISYAESLH